MEVIEQTSGRRKISQAELDELLQQLEIWTDNLENCDNPFLFENLCLSYLDVPPGTRFLNAHFVNVDFLHTSLRGCHLSESRWVNCYLPCFHDCKFSRNEFVTCTLKEDATGCEFQRDSFSRSVLRSMRFDSCSFVDINFDDNDFMGVSFRRCSFERIDFRRAGTLDSISFGNARLTHCSLAATDFSRCNGFILDGTDIKDARLPVRSRDPWSQLVRSYTGAHMAFNAMVLGAFFVPLLLKGLGLVVLGRLESRIGNHFMALSQALSEGSGHTLRLPAEICGAPSCKAVPVWQIVLGIDQDRWVTFAGLVLLVYNILRAFLTWRVGPLREDQQMSWKTPRYLPDFPVHHGVWELNFGYLFHWRSFWRSKEDLWNAYAPLWWMHRLILTAFYFAMALFAFHFVQFLQETVLLPA